MFALGGFAGCSPRLSGMTWGAEDLSAAVGATTNRDASGNLDFTYQLARSLCLLAAVAANMQPIDTVSVNFKDAAALRQIGRPHVARVSPARLRFIPIRLTSSTTRSLRRLKMWRTQIA